MGYTSVLKEVEVDVDMDDFEDQDLIDEVEKRGLHVESPEELKRVTQELYDLWTGNKIYVQIDPSTVDLNPEIQRRLERLFDIVLGRVA